MDKNEYIKASNPEPASADFFSADRIRRIRIRNKARRLTEYCVVCNDIKACQFGQLLKTIHETSCALQVGQDFMYCSKCEHTLNGDCPIDKAELSEALHEQLGRCTAKRGYGLPLCLLRLDVLAKTRPLD